MKQIDPAQPVSATDRVSDVLARDEKLVEIFVQHSTHFGRLRNRTMRRVMARLITVEQAALTAGIPAGVLIRDLNAALGITPSSAEPVSAAAVSAAAPRSSRPAGAGEVEVDVRPLLRAGEEPFSHIMAAVAALQPGQTLHLRATFEPIPLFVALEKRGFIHESAEHAEDDWSVWFWRPEPEPIVLDVRELDPPEPLLRTLAALETLPAGQSLVQINLRVPQFLLPLLAERGFACEVDESHVDRVLVRIRRAR